MTTEDEFDEALVRARENNEGPVLIELMLDRFDTSDGLNRLGAALFPDKGKQAAE